MGAINRQRLVKPYMWLVVVTGAVCVALSLYYLPFKQLDLPFLLLFVVTVGVGSRGIIKLPRFKSNVSISDIFIFLTILLYDGEAAVLLGAVETFYASTGITKKRLTMVFNSAAMACSVFITVWVLRLGFGSIVDLAHGDYSSRLVIAICVMASVDYVANSGLVAVAGALRADRPLWDTWRRHYFWTSLTYFAGASAAGIIVRLLTVFKFYALLGTAPIVGIIYLTYSTYLKNLESSAAQAEQAKRHVSELKQSEERFHSAFDYAPIGMALVAADGRWLQVNHSLCEVVGYSEEDLLGNSLAAITPADYLDPFLAHANKVLAGEILTYQMESRYTHKLGHEVWVMVGMSRIWDGESGSPHLILQIQDITDRKRAEEQLLYEAFHDPLTGLPNRACFVEQLTVALDAVKSDPDKSFAVLFLDLDRFKIINDSLGHMIGDQLLKEISGLLVKCLRPGDIIARLGGDEFTVLLDGIKDPEDASKVAEQIQKQLAQSFNLSGYEAYTTASIGIAFSNSDYNRPEELLRDADTAMYQAKSLGKARSEVFDKGMHARAMNLLQLETDLRRAIERGEFFIDYQPIVSLSTGDLRGFEALVRWRHPERGLISPEQFISVAEETGLIVPIGQWVLKEACGQMRAWQDLIQTADRLFMSVNLSSKHFLHTNFLKEIFETLDTTGLDPHSLKLEITESTLMENIEAVADMLKQLRLLGIELSIDDFGTGYSSLSYLHRLPISTLKIDRSFVSQMIENNENKEIVRTVIMLGQNLGMTVIAEGVETKQQLEQLKELGCETGQGYLFSVPINVIAAEKLILNDQRRQTAITSLDEPFEEEGSQPVVSTYLM